MSKDLYSHGTLQFLYPIWRKLNNKRLYDSLIESAVQDLTLEEGQKVLDLACGPGYTFTYLKKHLGDSGKIVAVDYSHKMLSLAEKTISDNKLKNIELINADAATVNLSELFDASICVLGLSVIPDWQVSFKKMISCTKVGGKIAIIDSVIPEQSNIVAKMFMYMMFKWVGAKNRDIINFTKDYLSDVTVREFRGGKYFIVIGTVR